MLNGTVFAYMQRRSKTAKRCPDVFGFFGGHAEGSETPEEALAREIREELSFIVSQPPALFDRYEYDDRVMHVFTQQVGNDFEDIVVIGEGEYGKFMDEKAALAEREFTLEDKGILLDFFREFSVR